MKTARVSSTVLPDQPRAFGATGPTPARTFSNALAARARLAHPDRLTWAGLGGLLIAGALVDVGVTGAAYLGWVLVLIVGWAVGVANRRAWSSEQDREASYADFLRVRMSSILPLAAVLVAVTAALTSLWTGLGLGEHGLRDVVTAVGRPLAWVAACLLLAVLTPFGRTKTKDRGTSPAEDAQPETLGHAAASGWVVRLANLGAVATSALLGGLSGVSGLFSVDSSGMVQTTPSGLSQWCWLLGTAGVLWVGHECGLAYAAFERRTSPRRGSLVPGVAREPGEEFGSPAERADLGAPRTPRLPSVRWWHDRLAMSGVWLATVGLVGYAATVRDAVVSGDRWAIGPVGGTALSWVILVVLGWLLVASTGRR